MPYMFFTSVVWSYKHDDDETMKKGKSYCLLLSNFNSKQ